MALCSIPKHSQASPLTEEYARIRTRFEPLHEMTQMKGDSETHPKLSPEDEFADYETWDKANLTGTAAQTEEMLPGNYARSALKRGMELEAEIGANPFKQGFIGSTDSHTSLATAGENNYFGKASIMEPGPERWKHVLIQSQTDDSLTTYAAETTASGLAGVWARRKHPSGSVRGHAASRGPMPPPARGSLYGCLAGLGFRS